MNGTQNVTVSPNTTLPDPFTSPTTGSSPETISPTLTDPVTTVAESSSDGPPLIIIALTCGAGLFILVLVIVGVIWWRRCKHPRAGPSPLPHPDARPNKTAVRPTDSLAGLEDAPPPPSAHQNGGRGTTVNGLHQNNDVTSDESSEGQSELYVNDDTVQTLQNGSVQFMKGPKESPKKSKVDSQKYLVPHSSFNQFDRKNNLMGPPFKSEADLSKDQDLRKRAENKEQWWTLSPPIVHGQINANADNKDDDGVYYRMDKQSPSQRISMSPPVPKDILVGSAGTESAQTADLPKPPKPCGKGKKPKYVNEAVVLETPPIYQNPEEVKKEQDVDEDSMFYENVQKLDEENPMNKHFEGHNETNNSFSKHESLNYVNDFVLSGFEPPAINTFQYDEDEEPELYENIEEEIGRPAPNTQSPRVEVFPSSSSLNKMGRLQSRDVKPVTKPKRLVPNPTSPIALTMSHTTSEPAIPLAYQSQDKNYFGKGEDSRYSWDSHYVNQKFVSPKKKTSAPAAFNDKPVHNQRVSGEDDVYEIPDSPISSTRSNESSVYVNVTEDSSLTPKASSPPPVLPKPGKKESTPSAASAPQSAPKQSHPQFSPDSHSSEDSNNERKIRAQDDVSSELEQILMNRRKKL